MTNVLELVNNKLGISTTRDDLKHYPINSVCGKACWEIAEKTLDLLKICDPHEDVVMPIKQGALVAIEIVCFG